MNTVFLPVGTFVSSSLSVVTWHSNEYCLQYFWSLYFAFHNIACIWLWVGQVRSLVPQYFFCRGMVTENQNRFVAMATSSLPIPNKNRKLYLLQLTHIIHHIGNTSILKQFMSTNSKLPKENQNDLTHHVQRYIFVKILLLSPRSSTVILRKSVSQCGTKCSYLYIVNDRLTASVV
jgi:hypothetical protein